MSDASLPPISAESDLRGGLQPGPPGNWVGALKRFVDRPAPERADAVEHCELCSAEIPPRHPHLVEIATQRLLCACPACALLFSSREARRFRRVPRDVVRLREVTLSDADWEAFRIPIGLAFFYRSSQHERVIAMYPGPAGATESTLDLQAWDRLVADNPALGALEDDVEALLVHRIGDAREIWRLPIDRCFALTGIIRSHWHGLSGGEAVRDAIADFFSELRREAGEEDADGEQRAGDTGSPPRGARSHA